MRTSIVVQPSVEPISLAEAKSYLRQYATFDDADISDLITAARQWCQSQLPCAFCTATYETRLDNFHPDRRSYPWSGNYGYGYGYGYGYYGLLPPLNIGNLYGPAYGDHIVLPYPPLQSVTSITYIDANGTQQTLDPSLYIVSAGRPGRIAPAFGTMFPVTQPRIDAVTVTFVAGYGDASTIPYNVKQAIKVAVYYLYHNRGLVNAELPEAITSLLMSEQSGRYI